MALCTRINLWDNKNLVVFTVFYVLGPCPSKTGGFPEIEPKLLPIINLAGPGARCRVVIEHANICGGKADDPITGHVLSLVLPIINLRGRVGDCWSKGVGPRLAYEEPEALPSLSDANPWLVITPREMLSGTNIGSAHTNDLITSLVSFTLFPVQNSDVIGPQIGYLGSILGNLAFETDDQIAEV
jgi:hypothetical protein